MKNIITRDLRDHLQSRQFAALLVLSVILFGSGGIISAKKYREQTETFRQRIAQAHKSPSTLGIFVYPEPSPLRFLAEGGDKALPYGYLLSPMGSVDPLPSNTKNIKMPEVPELDWAFLVKIVFSLYAVLLGYGVVAGEKEDGTLRQALANPLGRIKFLTAKGFAILITLCIPLIVGMILSLLITGIGNPGVFTGASMIRILVTVIISIVFISVFVFMAVCFSSMINPSSLTLFFLLVAWFCLAVVVPNASGIIAQHLRKVPTEYQMSRSNSFGQEELHHKQIGPVIDRFHKGEIKTENEFKEITDKLYVENEKKRIAWEDNYRKAMQQRLRIARNLTRISPVGLFQFAAEGIAGTGYSNEARFRKNLGIYSARYDSYILNKVGKLVPVIKGMVMLREDGGVGGVVGGSIGGSVSSSGETKVSKSIVVVAPQPVSYQGDMSDFPWFVDTPPSLGESLKSALFDLAGLLVWNIILALLAFGVFLRADVR